MKKITILGGGFLGLSLAEGFVKSKAYSKEEMVLIDRQEGEKNGFLISTDVKSAIASSKVIILALQPKDVKGVCGRIEKYLNTKVHIVVSPVAGLNLEVLRSYFTNDFCLVRIMPNIASSQLAGLTAVYSRDKDAEGAICKLFKNIGEVYCINEGSFDAFTVISGCGVAFVMKMIRAMESGSCEIGFHATTARKMVNQVFKSAQILLKNSSNNPEVEIDKVTTPKGITITGLNQMEKLGLSASIVGGMKKAFRKLLG